MPSLPRLWSSALGLAQNVAGRVGIEVLNGLGATRRALGVDPAPRGLRPEEVAELRTVLGDSVDYGKVRVHANVKSGLVGSDRAMALGNDIYLPDFETGSPSALVHEMVHVWQYQNGGSDYAAKALEAQLFGDGEGSRRGYDWEAGIARGRSWDEQSPEQQAQLIQNGYEAGWFDHPDEPFEWNRADYSGYLETAVERLRRRQGAP